MSILEQADPEIWQAIQGERRRQQDGLEMIASENYTSPAVMAAQGSVLTNKYAEGYPGKRYYGGCEFVDVAERLAIERVLQAVRRRAGQRPAALRRARPTWRSTSPALNPGDTILAMDLAHGGHLTHGMRLNFSGKLYQVDQLRRPQRRRTHRLRPGGRSWPASTSRSWSSPGPAPIRARSISPVRRDLPRRSRRCSWWTWPTSRAWWRREQHASPVPFADFVTSTTHKTLRGPRGGFILCKQDWVPEDQLRRSSPACRAAR